MDAPGPVHLTPMCKSHLEGLQYLIHSYLIIQLLSLCGIILINSVIRCLQARSWEAREQKRVISLDIDRQTRQPSPRPASRSSRISNQGSNTPPTRRTQANKTFLQTSPSSKGNNEHLLPRNISETTSLLSLSRQGSPQSYKSIQRKWRSANFKTSLHARYSLRCIASMAQRLGWKIHAWTMLQPKSIPIVGWDAPSNSVSLGIAAMLFVNMIFLLISLPTDWCFFPAITSRAAILYIINIPMLYFLSMRAQPRQSTTSWSHIATNIFHRRLGEFMVFLILIHATGQVLPLTLDLVIEKEIRLSSEINGKQLDTQITSTGRPVNTNIKFGAGLLALFSLLTLIATSTSSVRKTSHRTFLYIHGLSHLAAQCFIFVHTPFARPYIGIVIAVWGFGRLGLRRCAQASFSSAIPTILHEGQLVLLTIYPEPLDTQHVGLKSYVLKHLVAPWAPGCYAYLKIKCLEEPFDKEWHLCYLMSVKNNTDVFFKSDETQLLIAVRGSWSRHLMDKARRLTIWSIELEGPYGSVRPLEMLRDLDSCILVASIPGMASILPIAKSLVDWSDGYHPLTDASTPWKQRVILFVMCYEQHSIDWLQQQFSILGAGGIKCKPIWPTKTHPDSENELVNGIRWELEENDSMRDKRAGIVCCGTRNLEKIVRESASAARSKGHQVLVDTLPF